MKKNPFWTVDRLLAVCAMIVSFGTFSMYIYQTHLIRVQQHAAVWPNLELGPSIHITEKEGYYTIVLENSGVGPAILEEANIVFKGKKYRASFWYFFKNDFLPKNTSYQNISSSDLYAGRVIQAGKRIELLRTNDLQTAKSFLEIFSGDTPQVSLDIVYRSIYNEHWKITGGFGIPQKIE
jgi:hypothetical protein